MNEELNLFIEEQLVVNNKELTADTRIEEDLRIYGDDAVEFLIAYGRKFNVDLSNFMAADYFSPEGFDMLSTILRFFQRKPKPVKNELTVNDLQKGIVAGVLDEEVINS
jgi:hypothetical protein